VTRILDSNSDLTAVLNEEIWSRLQRQPPTGVKPRLASTLMLLDRSGPEPKILMGRRNPASKFMPGKFVFPGGRIEAGDRKMNAAGALPLPVEERLARIDPKSHSLPRALALGAIRETFEETGIVLGAADMGAPETAPAGEWQRFAGHGFYPLIDNIHFIARATTPPRQARRFDTVFLAAETSDIATTIEGAIGPDRELVELVWVPLSQAHDLELPLITSVVLCELDRRIAAGMGHHLPAPWYRVGPKGWLRTEL